MRRTFYVAIAMVALGMPQARAAADLVLFLQQVSRVGPTQFVRWADGYYAERKEGKSGFQGSDAQLGSVTGAIMGGALGMLKDDMFSGIKQGAESGKDTGGKLGNAYGVVQGQSQALEDLITDYVNDRQPLLDKVEQMVDTCLQTGQPFSTCRRAQNLVTVVNRIAQLNMQYCRQAIQVPSPMDRTKAMLPPEICQAG